LKILKNFGLKVENSKKFPVESWKKVVSSATDSRLRRKPCDTDPAPGPENPDFFCREISKTKKFPVEN